MTHLLLATISFLAGLYVLSATFSIFPFWRKNGITSLKMLAVIGLVAAIFNFACCSYQLYLLFN